MSDKPNRSAAELLREVAAADSEAHDRALGRGYESAARPVLPPAAAEPVDEIERLRASVDYFAKRFVAIAAELAELRRAAATALAVLDEAGAAHPTLYGRAAASTLRAAL